MTTSKISSYVGRYLGFGGMGTVFCPPIPAGDIEPRFLNEKYVGKLFEKMHHAKDEIENDLIVQRIDPHFLFTLHSVSHSKINLSRKDYENLKQALSASIRITDKYVYQIVYPYGGTRYYDALETFDSMNFETFLFTILFFMKKVGQMNKYGLYHYDIKDANILYDSYKGLLYLIDFGIAEENSINRVIVYLNNDAGLWESPELSLIFEINHLRVFQDWTERELSERDKSYFDQQIYDEYYWMSIYNNIEYILHKREKRLGPKIKNKIINRFEDFFKSRTSHYDKFEFTEFYKKLIHIVIQYKKDKNVEPLKRFFNTKYIRERQDSWGLGKQLLGWTYVMYDKISREKKTANNVIKLKVLDEVAKVILNDLLSYNIEKRLPILDAFHKIMDVLESNFNNIYLNYKSFEGEIEIARQSPSADEVLENLESQNVEPVEFPLIDTPENEQVNLINMNETRNNQQNVPRNEEDNLLVECKKKRKQECISSNNCSWVETDKRKYCRKRKEKRPINFSIYPCRFKQYDECTSQELKDKCLWRNESQGQVRKIRAHCRKIREKKQ